MCFWLMCSMPLLWHMFRLRLPFEVAHFRRLRMLLSKTLPTMCRTPLRVLRMVGCAALVMGPCVQCSLPAPVPPIVCALVGSRACLLRALEHPLLALCLVLLGLRFLRRFVWWVARSVALGMGLAVPLCCHALVALLHLLLLLPCRFRLALVPCPLRPPCLSHHVLVGPCHAPALVERTPHSVPLGRAWGVVGCCPPLMCVQRGTILCS